MRKNINKDGIKVSINNDNRTVSDISLNEETSKVIETFNVNRNEYREIYIYSVNLAFCDKKIIDN